MLAPAFLGHLLVPSFHLMPSLPINGLDLFWSRYFGKSLSDLAAAEAGKEAQPVPIGLIHSSIGGTTIQQWMPPGTVGNATCLDNNCGVHSEQLDPRKPVQPSTEPNCANASLRNVWGCPSGTCSTLWHGMIGPWVNTTISGAIWCAPVHVLSRCTRAKRA